ncbi:polysaccharide biosynthesis/export family protein [Vibrio hippocampi]|nr:polysaccharide biosynthesis/export family protein [Vibrio hippocampi]
MEKIKQVIAVMLMVCSAPMAWATAEVDNYRLGSGDRIEITVYAEPELSQSVLISSSGMFDYPYLGNISAKGKTVRQLQAVITDGLRGDYLVNPKVMVNVIEYRKIYVNGEVKQPGGYIFQPGLTVEKAIALAGGFTDRAARKKINITPNENGMTQKGVALHTSVAPGDIIVIEQSFF